MCSQNWMQVGRYERVHYTSYSHGLRSLKKISSALQKLKKHCKIRILTQQQYPMGKRLNLFSSLVWFCHANHTFKELVNSRCELFPVKHIRKSFIHSYLILDWQMFVKIPHTPEAKHLMRKYEKSVSLVFMITSLQQSTLACRARASHCPSGTVSKNHAADFLSWCSSKKLELLSFKLFQEIWFSPIEMSNVTGH